MEFQAYVEIIRKYFWLAVLTTLLGGGAAYGFSKSTPPTYTATATLQINLANDPRNDISQSLTAGGLLAKTYVEQILSPETLEAAARALGLPTEPELLGNMSQMIDVVPVRDTQLIRLTADNQNPALAQRLANTIAQVFIDRNAAGQQARYDSSKKDLDKQVADLEARIGETQKSIAALGEPADARNSSVPELTRVELTRLQSDLASYQTRYTILLNSAEEFRLAAARYSDQVSVFAPARLPLRPSRPNTSQNTLLGLALGLMLGAGIGFAREYLDDSLKSSEEVTAALGLSTLGNIFRLGHVRKLKDGLITSTGDCSSVSEGYRTLRTNLQYCGIGREAGGLVVTSAGPGEGKTTTAANLAIVMAQAGLRVILVDSDLRRPAIGRMFDLNGDEGLSTLLRRPGYLIDGDLRATQVANLRVIPSGPVPPNPAELLASPRMTWLVNELSRESDVVIFDSPPVLAVTDATIVASKVGGALLVVDAGATRREAGLHAQEALEKAGAKVLGVVLNKQHLNRGSGYYEHYHNSKNGHRHPRNGKGET